MSDPENSKANKYFSKIKEGLKNFEYKAKAENMKEKLSSLKNQAESSEYMKKFKDYAVDFKTKLQEEKDKINRTQSNTPKENGSIFTRIFMKTKDVSNNLKDSIKDGEIKEKMQKLAQNLKKYEYSKKFKEVSHKAQEKLKEANIPEKLNILKEKASDTAEHYHIKEKIADYSEKGKETAKDLAEKSKEKLYKGKHYVKNNWFFLGRRMRDYGKKRARSFVIIGLAFVFVYGFATSLPKAYYDYQRYLDERERERRFQEEVKNSVNNEKVVLI